MDLFSLRLERQRIFNELGAVFQLELHLQSMETDSPALEDLVRQHLLLLGERRTRLAIASSNLKHQIHALTERELSSITWQQQIANHYSDGGVYPEEAL